MDSVQEGKKGTLIQPIGTDTSKVNPPDSSKKIEIPAPGAPKPTVPDTNKINKKRRKNN